MGAMQNNATAEKKGKNSRGSAKNADRLEAFRRGSAAGGGDWGGCDADRLQAVVVGITKLGGAVTFGLSRDKGAHSLTLLLDDARSTLWFNGNADLDEALTGVIGTLDQMD